MDLISTALFKFNEYSHAQKLNELDVYVRGSEAKNGKWKILAEAIGLNIGYRLERVVEFAYLTTVALITFTAVPLAIVLSSSLKGESSKVKDFVGFVFGLVKAEYDLAKMMLGDIFLSHCSNRVLNEIADVAFYYIDSPEKDPKKAFEFAKIAADLGDHAGAQLIVSNFYAQEDSPVPQDLALARKYKEKAAKNNEHLLIGLADEEKKAGNEAKAIEFLKKAIALGSSVAVCDLVAIKAAKLTDLEGKEFDEVIELYTKAAEKSLPALYEKGVLLLRAGKTEEGYACIEEAATLGWDPAKLQIAQYYDTQRNNEKAIVWYRSSIDAYPEYEIILANLLALSSMETDRQEAIKRYENVINNKLQVKQALFGLYMQKEGPEAAKIIIREADAGELYAKVLAGTILLKGECISVNKEQAYKYLYQAALEGDKHAAYQLALISRDSDRQPNKLSGYRPLNALIFLKLAKRLGHQSAGEEFTKLFDEYQKVAVYTRRNNFRLEGNLRKKAGLEPLSGIRLSEVIECGVKQLVKNNTLAQVNKI